MINNIFNIRAKLIKIVFENIFNSYSYFRLEILIMVETGFADQSLHSNNFFVSLFNLSLFLVPLIFLIQFSVVYYIF